MSTPHVPVSPGDQDRPEWWSPTDEAILAGELAKLAELPRPAALSQRQPYVPGAPAPAPRRTHTRDVGAIIAALALMVLLLLVAFGPERPAPAPCAGDPAGCADFITPTTYGPPGPAGGAFTSMPAREVNR